MIKEGGGMKKKQFFLDAFIIVFLFALCACGLKENESTGAADTGKEDKEEAEEKEDRKEDEKETETESLDGTFWVSEDNGGELFFYEDGTFYYRELVTEDDGLSGYSTIGAEKLTWEQDGKKVTFTAKWGYAPEDSDEDVDSFKGSIRDGKLVVSNLPGKDGEKYTFVESTWPDLPSLDDAPKMVGEWKLVASSLEGNLEIYGEGDMMDKHLRIWEENGKYHSSGQDFGGGGVIENWDDIGMTLIEEPVYDGFMNSCWRADLDEETKDGIWREVTLYNDDILTLVESNYHDDRDQDYIFISYQYFVREDADEDAAMDLFCPKKVTVSDVHEFASAIEPNTEIILKGGTYDLSELTEDDQSEYLIYERPFDDIWWTISCERLAIRAEDGEDVEIVTKNPMIPVIKLENCNGVWIEGITAGHDADVTACGGPVIKISESGHIFINKCSLYGCGTYGIESDNAGSISVRETEIYDCSNGSILLNEYSQVFLHDCLIHDNTDGYDSLISVLFDSHIKAENCEFRNNSNKYAKIITTYEYSSAEFINCIFAGNEYDGISESAGKDDVIFTDCEFED